MTLADDMVPDGGGDESIAAEYVLGVLPSDERRLVAQRIDAEEPFARLVDRWEVNLAPLGADYTEVEAPAEVKIAVDRRLFGSGQLQGKTLPAPGLLSSLAFWRGLAAAAIAALVLYIALPQFGPSPVEAPPARLVASLGADGSDVRYLAVYDAEAHDVGLSHVSGDRAQGRDFELWLIEGQQAPISLGVIPVGATVHLPVAGDLLAKLAAGAVFAITLEPAGGSPSGDPTGPVVAAGDLKSI